MEPPYEKRDGILANYRSFEAVAVTDAHRIASLDAELAQLIVQIILGPSGPSRPGPERKERRDLKRAERRERNQQRKRRKR